jgi:hypothetical protein
MVTGRQIREARTLLNLQCNELAAKVKTVATAAIVRAESVHVERLITIAQAAAIRSSLGAAGIEFILEIKGASGVCLRKST